MTTLAELSQSTGIPVPPCIQDALTFGAYLQAVGTLRGLTLPECLEARAYVSSASVYDLREETLAACDFVIAEKREVPPSE